MAKTDPVDASRQPWVFPCDTGPTLEMLRTGAMLRIAAALERLTDLTDPVERVYRERQAADLQKQVDAQIARKEWREAASRQVDSLSWPSGSAKREVKNALYWAVRLKIDPPGADDPTPEEAMARLAAVDLVATLRSIGFRPGSKRAAYRDAVLAANDPAGSVEGAGGRG